MSTRLSSFSALLLALSATACQSTERPLVAGEDSCRYCRMTIDDTRFGGMLVTTRGRLETFDSIECLASYVGSLPDSARARSVLVADFEHPSRWVEVSHARFVHQGQLRSPMGRELAAFGADQSVDALQARYGGRIIDWNDVVAMVRRDRFTPSGAGPDSTRDHSAHTH